MKKELTEALVFAAEGLSPHPISRHEFRPILAAARLVERLLPGMVHDSEDCYLDDEGYCSTVHWDEELDQPKPLVEVWDEGIVKAVARVVKTEGGLHNHRIDRTMPGMDWPDSFYEDIARAVLSALAGLLEKGE